MHPIDVVVTWVDDTDQTWRAAREHYWGLEFAAATIPEHRFRDYGTIRYALRSIDQNMPYVRTIYLVTCGHVPSWLRPEGTRLKVITHEQIFPEGQSVLPTFSSSAIECCLARIPALAEHFVYFNDDTFLLQQVPPERFFLNGLPRDRIDISTLFFGDIEYTLHCHYLNCLRQTRYGTDRIQCVLRLFPKLFSAKNGTRINLRNAIFTLLDAYHFHVSHGPAAHLRSVHQRAYSLFPEAIERTLQSRFRSIEGVSQELFRAMAMMDGMFEPVEGTDILFAPVEDTAEFEERLERIAAAEYPFVCVNDSHHTNESQYRKLKPKIIDALERALPHPASFEEPAKPAEAN